VAARRKWYCHYATSLALGIVHLPAGWTRYAAGWPENDRTANIGKTEGQDREVSVERSAAPLFHRAAERDEREKWGIYHQSCHGDVTSIHEIYRIALCSVFAVAPGLSPVGGPFLPSLSASLFYITSVHCYSCMNHSRRLKTSMSMTWIRQCNLKESKLALYTLVQS
jgi:hypothetical protein